MLDQEIMNRHFPTRTLFGEFIFSLGILAAPFPKTSKLHAAAIVHRRSTNKVMDENKSVLGVNILKRSFEPLVLMLAERPRPIAPIATALRRVTKRIEHDELGISPFPLIVVLWQANELLAVIVASKEAVRFWVGKQSLSRLCGPHGRPAATRFTVVISQHEKERGRMAKTAEVVALRQILRLRQFRLDVLSGHERVAQFKMKVWCV